MKKTYIGFAGLSLLLLLGTQTVHAQQGFGTDKPARSAAVDIQSSKRGLLIPRVDLVEITNGVTPINTPAQSLMVYNEKKQNDVAPGYYYWDTDRWVRFAQQGDITAINLKGDVTGPTNATVVGAIQGVEVSNVNPTANQVLTFVPGTGTEKGKWVPTSITPDVITEGKNVTAGSNKVSLSEGAKGASLKDYTVDVVEGNLSLQNIGGQVTNGQIQGAEEGDVLVSTVDDKGNKITKWTKQSDIVPATTHTIVKDATGNKLTSNVNGEVASVDLVDNVTNTVKGSSIVTTVNGVASTSVDLTDAIQAGQKTVEVVKGTNTTVTKAPETGDSKHTTYAVNVSNEAIQAAQKLTTVSQGTGVKVTPDTTTTPNTTDYNVAINTDGGNAGDVLTVVEGAKPGESTVKWTTPAEHKNIYTHDGTLTANRTVDFGEHTLLKFKRGNIDSEQSHEFTYDDNHPGFNMFGKDGASISLVANKVNAGQLKLSHSASTSEINSSAQDGLKIVTEREKDIIFETYHYPSDNSGSKVLENVVIQGDGGLRVNNINKSEFKGSSTDKVVVADADGVLKTLKAAMPKFFYMPSVMVPTAQSQATQSGVTYNNATRTGTINLYAIYKKQFGTPVMSSPGASVLPVLPASELGFHVTYATEGVFKIVSIDANGLMTYEVSATANVNVGSFINIVFSVKEDN